jgi:deoxyribose-phosphate aldolase
MVISIGMLKSVSYQLVLDDVRQVADVVHASGGLIKVILETCMLNRFEKSSVV